MSERQTIPVVPLRGAVVFPGVTVPVSIGRASTLRAVEESAKHNQLLFAVAQRENVDRPSGEQLYSMGTIARVVHLQRTPNGLQLLLEGLERARVIEYRDAGEYLTANPLPADAGGVAGPIGLGFRVPLLVVSPWSRGGFVCHDTFDHTSLLRFLESRFGAEVPNLSAWRRSVCGDLTSAFNFVKHDNSVPTLPQPSATDSRITTSSCAVGGPVDLLNPGGNDPAGLESTLVPAYPVTVNSAAPAQEPGTAPAPSGCT